ncbi:protein of unknown function (plasmid) [Caballeronia sp. S22]
MFDGAHHKLNVSIGGRADHNGIYVVTVDDGRTIIGGVTAELPGERIYGDFG